MALYPMADLLLIGHLFPRSLDANSKHLQHYQPSSLMTSRTIRWRVQSTGSKHDGLLTMLVFNSSTTTRGTIHLVPLQTHVDR